MCTLVTKNFSLAGSGSGPKSGETLSLPRMKGAAAKPARSRRRIGTQASFKIFPPGPDPPLELVGCAVGADCPLEGSATPAGAASLGAVETGPSPPPSAGCLLAVAVAVGLLAWLLFVAVLVAGGGEVFVALGTTMTIDVLVGLGVLLGFLVGVGVFVGGPEALSLVGVLVGGRSVSVAFCAMGLGARAACIVNRNAEVMKTSVKRAGSFICIPPEMCVTLPQANGQATEIL